jgi:predicted RNA binding protein YcfA (HicA-like mRNA interferase family)
MGKKMPKLKLREVKANLTSLGFRWKRTDGSHETWERPADATRKRAIVTVDAAETQFGEFLMRSMIRQSGFSREEFCPGILKVAAKSETVPATEKSS